MSCRGRRKKFALWKSPSRILSRYKSVNFPWSYMSRVEIPFARVSRASHQAEIRVSRGSCTNIPDEWQVTSTYSYRFTAREKKKTYWDWDFYIQIAFEFIEASRNTSFAGHLWDSRGNLFLVLFDARGSVRICIRWQIKIATSASRRVEHLTDLLENVGQIICKQSTASSHTKTHVANEWENFSDALVKKPRVVEPSAYGAWVHSNSYKRRRTETTWAVFIYFFITTLFLFLFCLLSYSRKSSAPTVWECTRDRRCIRRISVAKVFRTLRNIGASSK